jgi:hypothetical protein
MYPVPGFVSKKRGMRQYPVESLMHSGSPQASPMFVAGMLANQHNHSSYCGVSNRHELTCCGSSTHWLRFMTLLLTHLTLAVTTIPLHLYPGISYFQPMPSNRQTGRRYVGLLMSFWLFLFPIFLLAAQPKEFFLDFFFLICIVGGGIKVHSTLRPLNGLLCQPRVIVIMEKSVE